MSYKTGNTFVQTHRPILAALLDRPWSLPLFSGFESTKKQEKDRQEPSVGIASEGPAQQTTALERQTATPTGRGAFSTGQDPRDMGGVTIQEFSKIRKIPEPEAWRMLRRGELVGRTHEGRLYVFASEPNLAHEVASDDLANRINDLIDADIKANQGLEAAVSAATETETIATKSEIAAEPAGQDAHQPVQEPHRAGAASHLPPLPGPAANESSGTLPVLSERSNDRISNTEIALLLDHLSLAKEENREILKMTQESIRKVTELTDTIVEMKDTVIEAKESQILFLKDQLDTKEKEIRKLLQQKEDLEILAQTIMADSESRRGK